MPRTRDHERVGPPPLLASPIFVRRMAELSEVEFANGEGDDAIPEAALRERDGSAGTG